MKQLCIAFFVLASCTAFAQESVLLRLNFDEGDKYIVKVDMNQGMGMPGTMNMSMTMAMSVKEVAKETIKTESKITAIKMNMNQAGVSMQYDSESETEDDGSNPYGQTMKAQFEPMMKSTIHQTLDRMGNILETRAEPTFPGLDQMAKNRRYIDYPKEKVSVGSTWVSETLEDGLNMKFLYTVTSIANGIVSLDVSGDISGEGTGTMKGQTNIDIESGMQTSSEMEMTISAEGMNMTMHTSMTMTKV